HHRARQQLGVPALRRAGPRGAPSEPRQLHRGPGSARQLAAVDRSGATVRAGVRRAGAPRRAHHLHRLELPRAQERDGVRAEQSDPGVTMHKGRTFCAGLGLLALARGGRDDRTEIAPSLLEPVALEHQLAFVDRAGGRALLVDVAAASPDPVVAELPPGAVRALRRPTQDELLVLCQGTPDSGGDAPAALAVIGASGETTSYVLGSRFDNLAVSEDGRYAVAYFSEEAGPQQDFLFNPNEIAIIDLGAPP